MTRKREKNILEAILTTQPPELEIIAGYLINRGELLDELRGSLVTIRGTNIGKNKTRKGNPDVNILKYPNVIPEVSTKKDWKDKLAKELKLKHKEDADEDTIFVFITNQDAKDEKINGKSFRKFCSEILGNKPENNFLVDQSSLVISLNKPNCADIRRDFLNIPRDIFLSVSNFIELLKKEDKSAFDIQIPQDTFLHLQSELLTFIRGEQKVLGISVPNKDENLCQVAVALLISSLESKKDVSAQYSFAFNKISDFRANDCSDEVVMDTTSFDGVQAASIVVIRNYTLDKSNVNQIKDIFTSFLENENKIIFLILEEEEKIFKKVLGTDKSFKLLQNIELREEKKASKQKIQKDYVNIEKELAEDIHKKMEKYIAVTFMMKSFDLDNEELREKIRKSIGVTKAEESVLLKHLLNTDVLYKAGSIIVFQNKELGLMTADKAFFSDSAQLDFDKFNLVLSEDE